MYVPKQDGFSLLEILVAFSIMAISLSIILNIFSSGVNTAMVAEEYTVATQVAESLMAKTGIETPLVEGEISGVENEKYSWRVLVTSMPEFVENNALSAEIMAVQVTIRWPGGGQNFRSIVLNSVKYGVVK